MAGQKSKKKSKKKKKSSWMVGRSTAAPAGPEPAAGKIVNASDKTFRELVLRSKLPVLVDFWADWCAPCKAMAPSLEELATQYAGMARVVKLNVDKNRKIPERYEIRSLPTLMMFKNGEVLQTFIGATSKGELSKVIAWAMGEE